jgi:hypothetical protein
MRGALIVPRDVGNAQPLARGDSEQLVAGAVGPARVRNAFGGGIAGDVRFPHHRTAADRVGDGAVQHLSARIESGEAHAVAVMRQPFSLQEMDVARLVEGDVMRAAKADPARGADSRDGPVGRVGVDPVGPLAGKTEQDRPVGGMALAGQRQRAVKVRLHSGRPLQRATLRESLDKAAGGGHRTHSV